MAYIRKTKDVHISPKLLEILNRIAPKSEVAKKLLKTKISKEDLVDDPVDYLSISKKDPTKISYAYPEKLAKIENPEEYWTFKGRVEAKPASAIKKVLKDIQEKELDIFTSAFKAATANKEYDFQVVSGDDIKKYYHQDSYNRNGYGSLANSCMKYDHCKNFFSIYTENPEVCQMLLMFDNNNTLIGRALLWNAVDVETGKEVKAMDRIYCMDDNKNIHYFKEWADENGYIARRNQKWADSLRFESHGKEFKIKLSIKVKPKAYASYPYVDTFKFWDEKKGIITNFLPQDNGYLRTMIGNDGRTFGANTLAFDNYQETFENVERLIKLDYPINGEYWRVLGELLNYSDVQDKYMLREHSAWVEEYEDTILVGEWAQYNNQKCLEERKAYLQDKKKGITGDLDAMEVAFKVRKNRFLRYEGPVNQDDANDDEFDDDLFIDDDFDFGVEEAQPVANNVDNQQIVDYNPWLFNNGDIAQQLGEDFLNRLRQAGARVAEALRQDPPAENQ